MVLSKRDYARAAAIITSSSPIHPTSTEYHHPSRQEKYVAAVMFRDFLKAGNPLFDGAAFLRMCGF